MKPHLFTFLAVFILSHITNTAMAQDNVVQGGSISQVMFNHDSTLTEFRIYIQRNIDYSRIDTIKILKKNKQSRPRFFVQLAITAESAVTDVSVLRSLQNDFDAQVIKIIQGSNGWENRSKQEVQLTFSVVFDPNGEYLRKLLHQRGK